MSFNLSLIFLLGFWCALACVLEFACLGEQRIEDSQLSATGRRLVAIGWAAFSGRCFYLFFVQPEIVWNSFAIQNYTAHSGVTGGTFGLLALNLVALGRVMVTAHQIDSLKFWQYGERRKRLG